jgi:ABC-type multidrug transport system ATPase subunit
MTHFHSSFKTGDTVPTSGTATVSGFNIKTQLSDARRNIGYCPQVAMLYNFFYHNLLMFVLS